MNLFAIVKKKDYRVLSAVVFIIAVLTGMGVEHLLYRISANNVGTILSDYGKIFTGYELERPELIRYMLKTEIVKYFFLFLISFTAFGIIGNLMVYFVTIYRYIFFLSAIFRSGIGSGYVLCICAVLLCFLFCIPAFLHCIKLSYHSYLYCTENNTKLCFYTKYQLQTEFKIGIILLLYIALGAVVQCSICSALFERMFM